MKIAVVFPQNNPFSSIKTKPVVMAAYPYIIYSMLLKEIIVITPFVTQPMFGCKALIIDQENSKKDNYISSVVAEINKLDVKIIEVHQDAKLAHEIFKHNPNLKVNLVKHNNYIINSFKERFSFLRSFYYNKYLKNITKIICISNYVKNSILSNYPKSIRQLITCYNSYGHIQSYIKDNIFSTKENQIIFAGKPVEKKGIKEFILALPYILHKYPHYKVIIMGAFFSEKPRYAKLLKSLLLKDEIKKLITSERLIIHKNLTIKEVITHMQSSKIAVLPTKTAEPFGLVCLEAHMSQCAVVSSASGALPEISGKNALYLANVSQDEIQLKLEMLIQDEEKLKKIALSGFEYCKNKFKPENLVKMLDIQRLEMLNAKD